MANPTKKVWVTPECDPVPTTDEDVTKTNPNTPITSVTNPSNWTIGNIPKEVVDVPKPIEDRQEQDTTLQEKVQEATGQFCVFRMEKCSDQIRSALILSDKNLYFRFENEDDVDGMKEFLNEKRISWAVITEKEELERIIKSRADYHLKMAA